MRTNVLEFESATLGAAAAAAESRRSIRQYEAAAIPEADLRELLRLAGKAPSAYNVQPWRFKADGICHLDLHTGNLLLTGDDHLSGVVDWEGACDGDHRFDLVTFAHNLETLGQHALVEPVWKHIEATLEPDIVRAYVAHMVLRLVDWQIRNDPGDVEHQMDIGDQLLARYA